MIILWFKLDFFFFIVKNWVLTVLAWASVDKNACQGFPTMMITHREHLELINENLMRRLFLAFSFLREFNRQFYIISKQSERARDGDEQNQLAI